MASSKKPTGYWYKNKESDTIWWYEQLESDGEFIFSFDKKKRYNFFQDYPMHLTAEQKEIFDRENAEFVAMFPGRQNLK